MSATALPRFQVDSPITAERLARALVQALSAISPDYFQRYFGDQRWFGSKTKRIVRVRLRDWAALLEGDPVALLALLDVHFADATTETYFLPLALRVEDAARRVLGEDEASAMLAVESPAGAAMLYEAFADPEFCRALLRRIAQAHPLAAQAGTFDFMRTEARPRLGAPASPPFPPRRLRGEQSNTSVVYGEVFILKGFRRLQNGINPDLEVSRFLTTRTAFRHTPQVAGFIAYAGDDGFQSSIAMLQDFVANEGDGWSYTLAYLKEGYERARAVSRKRAGETTEAADLAVVRCAAPFLAPARRLGELTGQMHRALAGDAGDPDFAPQPVTRVDLEQWAADMSGQITAVLRNVERAGAAYPPAVRARLRQVAQNEAVYRWRVAELLALDREPLLKIRHHGDYHLGQVLRAEDDFLVIDFEGEPARPLAERRTRHLALKDVAGMLRSFNYAAHAARRALAAEQDDAAVLGRWVRAWEVSARAAYLDGYLSETLAQGVSFLPPSRPLVERAIAIFELDKAIYELGYEANNRPDWVSIPLEYLSP